MPPRIPVVPCVPKRANRAAEYKGGLPLKNGGFPTQYYYKSSLHSVSQSAGCFLWHLPNPLQPMIYRFFHLVVQMAVEQAGQIVFLRRVVHQVRRFHHVARHGIHIAEIVD